jgi:hypothetical protein
MVIVFLNRIWCALVGCHVWSINVSDKRAWCEKCRTVYHWDVEYDDGYYRPACGKSGWAFGERSISELERVSCQKCLDKAVGWGSLKQNVGEECH